MSLHDTDRRGPVHTLIVHGVYDEEEIDWTLTHPDECVKETVPGGMFDDVEASYDHWPNCGIQHVIDGVGIDDVLRDYLEREVEVGEIKVVCVSTYDTYTHESDAWIEAVA